MTWIDRAEEIGTISCLLYEKQSSFLPNWLLMFENLKVACLWFLDRMANYRHLHIWWRISCNTESCHFDGKLTAAATIHDPHSAACQCTLWKGQTGELGSSHLSDSQILGRPRIRDLSTLDDTTSHWLRQNRVNLKQISSLANAVRPHTRASRSHVSNRSLLMIRLFVWYLVVAWNFLCYFVTGLSNIFTEIHMLWFCCWFCCCHRGFCLIVFEHADQMRTKSSGWVSLLEIESKQVFADTGLFPRTARTLRKKRQHTVKWNDNQQILKSLRMADVCINCVGKKLSRIRRIWKIRSAKSIHWIIGETTGDTGGATINKRSLWIDICLNYRHTVSYLIRNRVFSHHFYLNKNDARAE